jgi:hypothetical protein
MRKLLTVALLSIIILFQVTGQEAGKISLSGIWKFQIDRDDVGLKEEWFKHTLNDQIKLPGSMLENGRGDNLTLKTQWTGSIYDSSWFFNPHMAKYRQPGNLKFPFWLTPDKHYIGAAWYQKEIEIPKNWKGNRIVLFLERPHWETMVWVDDKPAGMKNSLSVPHQYDITGMISPGKHIITIRIDNRTKDINPGPDSHSITDQTQGNWNGIAGRLELIAGSANYFKDVQIYPNVTLKTAKVVLVLDIYKLVEGKITISAESNNSKVIQQIKPLETTFKSGTDTLFIDYPMGTDVQLWDEFNPALYNLTVTLSEGPKVVDKKIILFGMREMKINGTRFVINGRETFLRGTVENCVFPLTGYMPMDEASWARIFKICRSFGLNHMRFHSICPPEAAFIAADKSGFYLQPEGPSWANHGTSLGDGKPIDQYILDETSRIVKEYGNHPSFAMFAYGNEPRGNYVTFLDKWVVYWKNKDPRRLYTGASTGGSWKIIPQSEYLVRAKPRGLSWKELPNADFDYRDKLEDQKVPYVTHEMGQWCAFPNFNEIRKYKGPFKARNFELFKEDLSDKNMDGQGTDFLMASGKLQSLCYKAEIEASLRTHGLAGFQLLSLNDYTGQGTALVGVLDAFWDEKGYITAKEFSQFCNSTVPLARLTKFVYKNSEQFKANIEVSHFGPSPLKNAEVIWKVTNNGSAVASGIFKKEMIPIGNCIPIGNIDVSLADVAAPVKLNFEVTIGQYWNNWNIWVYPVDVQPVNADSIHIYNTLDSTAISVLRKGGKVLVLGNGMIENGKDVVQYFTPVFWNTSWFKMRPPHTTGIFVRNEHPVFTDFPTDYYSNYQWYELVNKQQVMNLDGFPPAFRSIVQPIDTWFVNRKLGLLFEANVESGKLMVCSADLTSDPDHRIVARQLLNSIKKYMLSEKFNPLYTVKLATVAELFQKKERKGIDFFTKGSPDELKPDNAKPKK